MVQLLIDENFNHRILRGLRRRLPTLDYLLVQDTEVFQKNDPEVLNWANLHNRVVVTHDVNTMTQYAYERLQLGQLLPGVVIIPKEMPIGIAIEELSIVLACSNPDDYPNRVIYLPI